MEHVGATIVGASSSNPELSQYDENYQVICPSELEYVIVSGSSNPELSQYDENYQVIWHSEWE